MNIRLAKDDLIRTIREHASLAMEARQVTSRLRHLLPTRLSSLKSEYAARQARATAAKAERQALVDQRFQATVDEYVNMLKVSWEARIQYETHVMLLEARRSLEAFRRSVRSK